MDCHQKHLYLHHKMTAVSKIDTKHLKIQLSFFEFQMFYLLFLAYNGSCCLLITLNLHSAAGFLDFQGVADEVDHQKCLLLLCLSQLWGSFYFNKSASDFADCRSIISDYCPCFSFCYFFLDSASFRFILCSILPFQK